jgi:hypothetical protein
MTKQQLNRLMQYRKEHNLTQDEVHTLYRVMGTMQEFVVLETILDQKDETKKPLTKEQIIETIQSNGGEAEFWCVHSYGKTIERLGYDAGMIYYLDGHKSEIDTNQHLIFYV